ncbi:hypothetical protein BH20ACT3_BH20ACT3_01310 [soil metagenome]
MPPIPRSSGTLLRVKQMLVAAAVSVVLVLAGCGGDDQPDAAEDESVEASDATVDFDPESGRMRVSDAEGETTFEVDGEGDFAEAKPDGESTYRVGDAAELPDDWPPTLEVPNGSTLTSAITSEQDGTRLQSVIGEVDGEVVEVHEGFRDRLTTAGYQTTVDNLVDDGADSIASLTATDATSDVVVSVSGGASTVGWSISVTPVT